MKELIKKILKEEIENEYSWIYDELSDPLMPIKEFIYNKMMDCEVIPSKKIRGYTEYIDKKGSVLFVDDIKEGGLYPFLFVNSKKIWKKCEEMGCSLVDFKEICKDMLYKVHKRKVYGITTFQI